MSSDEIGHAKIDMYNNDIHLVGEYSIINRTCVIHFTPDDLGLGNTLASKENGTEGPVT